MHVERIPEDKKPKIITYKQTENEVKLKKTEDSKYVLQSVLNICEKGPIPPWEVA